MKPDLCTGRVKASDRVKIFVSGTVKSPPPPVTRKPCNFRNPCVTGTKSISRECTWSREFCKVSNPCVTGTNSEIARPVGGTLLYIYTSRSGSTLGSGRVAILHGSGRVKVFVSESILHKGRVKPWVGSGQTLRWVKPRVGSNLEWGQTSGRVKPRVGSRYGIGISLATGGWSRG